MRSTHTPRTVITATALSAAVALSAATPLAAEAQPAPTPSDLSCAATEAASNRYTCTFVKTVANKTAEYPISWTQGLGVPVGTFDMESGNGNMTLTPTGIDKGTLSFAFADGYASENSGPYEVKGTFEIVANHDVYGGPGSLTIGEASAMMGNVDQSPLQGKGMTVWAAEDSNMLNYALYLGVDQLVSGQSYTLTEVGGEGIKLCNGDLYSARYKGDVGEPVQKNVGDSVTFQAAPDLAYIYRGSCPTDETLYEGDYVNVGSVAGEHFTPEISVVRASADGAAKPVDASKNSSLTGRKRIAVYWVLGVAGASLLFALVSSIIGLVRARTGRSSDSA